MVDSHMSFKEKPLMKINEGTVLFHPYVSKNSFQEVRKVLSGRWIGQGPLVDKFENNFKNNDKKDDVNKMVLFITILIL